MPIMQSPAAESLTNRNFSFFFFPTKEIFPGTTAGIKGDTGCVQKRFNSRINRIKNFCTDPKIKRPGFLPPAWGYRNQKFRNISPANQKNKPFI